MKKCGINHFDNGLIDYVIIKTIQCIFPFQKRFFLNNIIAIHGEYPLPLSLALQKIQLSLFCKCMTINIEENHSCNKDVNLYHVIEC